MKLVFVTCAISTLIAVIFGYLTKGKHVDSNFITYLTVHGVFKTLSALCFVYHCFDNLRKTLIQYKVYGRFVFIGQLLSLIGDVMLVLAYLKEVYFIIGGASFLLGHFAYMSSFVYNIWNTIRRRNDKKSDDKIRTSGIHPFLYIVFTGIFISITSYLIGFCYVIPAIKPEEHSLRILAISYTLMISVMVMLSPAGERLWLNDKEINMRFVYRLIGSFMFYLSDICVAREKFVAKDALNGAIGLPLYFAAQLVIASSV
jgi:uncharacterized membrane protein YhhN